MLKALLSFGDLNGGLALRSVSHFESDGIALGQVGERDSGQLVGMEEDVLITVLRSDETEIFIGQFFDCSLHECRK